MHSLTHQEFLHTATLIAQWTHREPPMSVVSVYYDEKACSYENNKSSVPCNSWCFPSALDIWQLQWSLKMFFHTYIGYITLIFGFKGYFVNHLAIIMLENTVSVTEHLTLFCLCCNSGVPYFGWFFLILGCCATPVWFEPKQVLHCVCSVSYSSSLGDEGKLGSI